MDAPENHNAFGWKLYGLSVAALLISILVLGFVSPELRTWILEEDGPVENLSAIGYFVCIVCLLMLAGRDARRHWDIAALLLAMGLRELDFNTRFTDGVSIAKIHFFTDPGQPLALKIFSASLGALVLYCLLHLAFRSYRSFLRSLKGLEPKAVCVATGVAFAFIAKGLDGPLKKIMPLYTREWSEIAEEVLELGIPVMFIIGLVLYFADKLPKRPSSGEARALQD